MFYGALVHQPLQVLVYIVDCGNFEKLYKDLKLAIRDFSSDKDFMTNLGDGDFFTYYSSTVKNYFFWKYENYLRD